MAKRREPARTGGAPVHWADGSAGEVVRARLTGDILYLDLTRGPASIALELTRLAPDFYAGPWAVSSSQLSRGAANATVTHTGNEAVSLAGVWYQGAVATGWRADGVRLG